MKGYLFIEASDFEKSDISVCDVVFWINENATISQKKMDNTIACISLDKRNNVSFFMNMLLHADFKNIPITAEYLNSDKLKLKVRYFW